MLVMPADALSHHPRALEGGWTHSQGGPACCFLLPFYSTLWASSRKLVDVSSMGTLPSQLNRVVAPAPDFSIFSNKSRRRQGHAEQRLGTFVGDHPMLGSFLVT